MLGLVMLQLSRHKIFQNRRLELSISLSKTSLQNKLQQRILQWSIKLHQKCRLKRCLPQRWSQFNNQLSNSKPPLRSRTLLQSKLHQESLPLNSPLQELSKLKIKILLKICKIDSLTPKSQRTKLTVFQKLHTSQTSQCHQQEPEDKQHHKTVIRLIQWHTEGNNLFLTTDERSLRELMH